MFFEGFSNVGTWRSLHKQSGEADFSGFPDFLRLLTVADGGGMLAGRPWLTPPSDNVTPYENGKESGRSTRTVPV